jgi:alpha-beta hydrolase superfamily lysophospholipase
MSTAPAAATAAPAAAKHEEGFFNAQDGLRLFWQSFSVDKPRAHVAFFHGFLDHSSRYTQLFGRLNARGYSVHTYDMRGHGQSQGRRGHVHSYDEFDSDAHLFFNRVFDASNGTKPFVVAHSNGALITALYLSQKPERARGVVYTSPYFGNAITPNMVQLFLAHGVGRIIPTLPIKAPLPSNVLTHDLEWQKHIDADPLHGRTLTPAWYRGLLASQPEVMRRAPEFKLPVLLMQAGSDSVANPKVSREWCDRIGSTDKRYVEYPGLFHELFMESEPERTRAMDEAAAWLDAHSG